MQLLYTVRSQLVLASSLRVRNRTKAKMAERSGGVSLRVKNHTIYFMYLVGFLVTLFSTCLTKYMQVTYGMLETPGPTDTNAKNQRLFI